MWRLRPKADVMPARLPDDRLKQVALVEGADDRGDGIHQLEMLPFHVAGKQALRIGSECEEPIVERNGELSAHRPDRVEQLPDEVNLFRRHGADRRHRKLVDVCFRRTSQQTVRELTHTRVDRGEPDQAGSLPTPARTGTSVVGAWKPTLDPRFDQAPASRPRRDSALA